LWDGFRAIVTIRRGEFDLRSRHGTDMRPWFPELAALADHIGRDVVLDGEVVALDGDGLPDFLMLDGRDLTPLPLTDRRRILADVVSDKLPLVLRSRPFLDGPALMAEAERLGLEGVVAKRDSECYLPGERVRHWVKVKTVAGRTEALRRLRTA
jgi:bifunctional non-homologous end joining protein LigD